MSTINVEVTAHVHRIESDRREWLETMIAACNGIIQDGADQHNALRQAIVAGATELRDRLQRELSGLGTDDEPR